MEFKPGRSGEISLRDYHRINAWSKGKLDKVNMSMAHYFESLKGDGEQTESMVFGAALHCQVLTPDLFENEYLVWEKQNRATKEGKASWSQACLDAGERTIIDSEMFERVKLVADAVLKHPIAGQLLKDGSAEQSFFWTDSRTGLKCKCRADYFRNDRIVLDVKTTDDASYDGFQRKIVNYRYHVQGAYYCDGIGAVERQLVNQFILIAVENKAPYNVAIYNLDKDALQLGRTAYRINMDKIVEYEKSVEKWAGYPLFIQDMLLPAWCK